MIRTPFDEPNGSKQSTFVSYSRKDAGIVTPLVHVLRAVGSDVFRDFDSIPTGIRWKPVVVDAIISCEVFLLFWCRHAARSTEVKTEYRQAISLDKRVVPILLDSTKLRADLSEYQWIDFRAALGQHEEEYVTEHVAGFVLETGTANRVVKRLRLLGHKELWAGGLELWLSVGRLLAGGE